MRAFPLLNRDRELKKSACRRSDMAPNHLGFEDVG
jgi:hypothetical protein